MQKGVKKMIFESIASKLAGKKASLDPLRKDMQELVDRANKLVSILNAGNEEINPALERALKTAPRQLRQSFESGDSEELFSVDKSIRRNFKALKAENNRLAEFLSDATAYMKINSYENKALKARETHKLSFRQQGFNLAATGKRFGNADESKVKFAAEIYRRVREETNVSLYEGGSERFNSDSVFNLIYDAIDEYNPNLADDTKNEMIEHAKAIAKAAIDEQELYLQGFISGSPSVNKEVDIISEVKKSKTAGEYLENNAWRLRD